MYFNGCLIKSGKYEHIRALHHDGILHCKTAKHFATIEDNQRRDILEGVTYTRYIGQGEISFKPVDAPDSEYKRFGIAEDTRLNNSPNEPMGNLFCMTGINLWDWPINQPKKVHPHNKGFGNCLVLIHNAKEFITRVCTVFIRIVIDKANYYLGEFKNQLFMIKYYPILLSKAGETKAISQLTQNVKDETSPVIEILPDGLDAIEKHLTSHWSFDDNQVLLDFSLYGPIDRPSLKVFFMRLNNAGVNFIPVVQQNSEAGYISFVKYLVTTYGCNICIRSSNGSGGFANYNAVITTLMTHIGTTRQSTLQLIDLGVVDGNNYNILPTIATALVQNLPHVAQWGDIIIASSSFPENLTAFTPANRVYRIRRYEWDVWNSVSVALAGRVKYGDYGTKYPFYIVTKFSGTCSIKYTTQNEYVIYRGEKSEHHRDGNGQYITFAGRLILTPDYSGQPFSWGDGQIHRIAHEVIASAKRRPGSATTWVEISQNHHLTMLHSLL